MSIALFVVALAARTAAAVSHGQFLPTTQPLSQEEAL
jgi:hypothetical protein